MRFDEWLREQRVYQTETFNIDYEAMRRDPDKLTEYVTMNLYAAIHEIVEAGQETPWKPWATVDKDKVWLENREKFVGEIVDVLFFLSNALVAVSCGDTELRDRYTGKMEVNRQRQKVGYDGTNKCVRCGRAFDDDGVRKVAYDADGELCDRCWEGRK